MFGPTATKRTRSTPTAPGRAGVARGSAADKANPWASLASRPLTAEDEREIAENTTGFFSLLAEWDRADRRESGDRPKTSGDRVSGPDFNGGGSL
jgi:hypothetical protein